jgi:acyl-CoA reductase-like NAD-dependent aldehyde dehydrogenase
MAHHSPGWHFLDGGAAAFECSIEMEANRLPYGLAACAFTDSAAEIAQITSGVETGMLGVNHTAISYAGTPFGGVQDSGYAAKVPGQ